MAGRWLSAVLDTFKSLQEKRFARHMHRLPPCSELVFLWQASLRQTHFRHAKLANEHQAAPVRSDVTNEQVSLMNYASNQTTGWMLPACLPLETFK